MASQKKILFVVPYPVGQAPSQRFRFEQYFEVPRKNGCEVVINSFLDEQSWRVLYRNGRLFTKTVGLIKGLFSRCIISTSVHRFDFVFIHREAAPIGPPIFEWIVAKIFKKKIIYDFDDAIWIPNTSQENKWVAWFKWHKKAKAICRWSYKVSCGNEYLCGFAKSFNSNVVLNPTTIDTDCHHNP